MFVQRFPVSLVGDHYHLASELAKAGCDVMVVAPVGGDIERYAHAPIGGDVDGYAHAGIRLTQVDSEANWFVSIRRVGLNFRPDIVHVFHHFMCGLYPLLIRGKGLAPKFILDIRSPLLKRGFVRRLIQIKNRFEIYFYHSILAHSIKSGYTVLGKERCLVHVPPGVNFSILLPLDAGKVRTETLRLVYIGSVDRKRQLDKMILGVVKAAQHVRLLLDIYADKQFSENLQRLVEVLGAQDYIHFRGMIKQEALFAVMPEYDAGLAYIPKELYDFAPPLKTIEYLACGLPVIATATEGNMQFVEGGKNGVLTEWTPEAYAEGIIRFARSPGVSMSPAEMRQSVEQYDWGDIVAGKLIPEYRRLIGASVEQ